MIVADSSELAARIALGARAAITAAAFASYVEREQIFDHVAGTVLELDGARRLGGDLALELAPRAWLVARLGGSAVDARFLRSGNPVPGAPRLLGTAEVRVATGPWQAAAIARGIGARPLAHGARGATSVVLDATASWRRGRLGLELSIDNALDAAWAEGEYHYASWWDQGAPRSALPRLHAVAGYPLGARLAITLDL